MGSRLLAQDYAKLPDWAAAAAQSAALSQAPADADAWVLLDRTEVAYVGGGEIRLRKHRVVRILGERGLSEGVFRIYGLGGKASRVKKLKGWNLRPDGELVKLDSDSIVVVSDAGEEFYGTATMTGAMLDRVAKGSVVAFESDEVVKSPLGPVAWAFPMEGHPIRRFELEVVDQGWWMFPGGPVAVPREIDLLRAAPWVPEAEVTPNRKVVLTNVPTLPKDEGAVPHAMEVMPLILLRFHDQSLVGVPSWKHWDGQATWLEENYRKRLQGAPALGLPQGLEGLQRAWSWMARELTYRQVYLTPERGWIPESPAETGRRRFGDCKDLSCFFMAQAQGLGFEVHPALASIGSARVDPHGVPAPVFNHVISAIKLAKSLGLPSEVDTPAGRFLLADPTHPSIPLGRLGDEHRGRSVLICTGGGGVWARVPDASLVTPAIQVSMTGSADAAGRVVAEVRIAEEGDAWGLRAVALDRGPAKLREYILEKLLNLPPTASLKLEGQGDPRETGHPFEITLALVHPQGMRLGGGEATLEDWWLGLLPETIQKPGRPRRSPVVVDAKLHLKYDATFKVPFKATPVLPEQSSESPFRSFAWKAESHAEGEGATLRLHLDHWSKPAEFPYDAREKGVLEWKKDRSLVKNLLADGLAFKIAP